MGPKNGGFLRIWGSKPQILVSRPQKGTFLRGTTSFDVFCVKICERVLAVAFLKPPPKKKIAESLGARNHAWTEPKPLRRFG